MPKRKTTDVAVAAPDTTVKPKKMTAKTAAASHKHAHKPVKYTDPAPVAEPSRTVTHEEIARLAYSYWESRGHQGGSPNEDWLRAERELSVLA